MQKFVLIVLISFCVTGLKAGPQAQATVAVTFTFDAPSQAAANRKRDDWLLDFAAAQRVPIDIVQRDAQGVPVLDAQGRQQVDTTKLPELRLRARQILHNVVRNYRVEQAGKAALAAKSVSEDAAGVP